MTSPHSPTIHVHVFLPSPRRTRVCRAVSVRFARTLPSVAHRGGGASMDLTTLLRLRDRGQHAFDTFAEDTERAPVSDNHRPLKIPVL